MSEIAVRPARAGDAPALARMHVAFGEYYVGIGGDDFRAPDAEGLAEFIAADVDTRPDTAFLVAELDGEPAGALWARIVAPAADAAFQVNPDVAATQLHIDYLVTDEAHRRRGVATALVAAAEEWGRERGATVALTDTYASSPVSVPFWHTGWANARLVKRLG